MILKIIKPGKPTEIIYPNESVNRDDQINAAELTVAIHNRDNPDDLWIVEKSDE